MPEYNPYQAPQTNVQAPEDKIAPEHQLYPELVGLRGWLVLVGIGIILSPVRILFQVVPIYNNIFSNGIWEKLTTPGGTAYHPLWLPILSSEMFINVCLVGVWIYIAVLYFTKKKSFPRWYIACLVFSIIFILVDAYAVRLILEDEPLFDSAASVEFVRTIVHAVIWIPYMLISKRVKATFVN